MQVSLSQICKNLWRNSSKQVQKLIPRPSICSVHETIHPCCSVSATWIISLAVEKWNISAEFKRDPWCNKHWRLVLNSNSVRCKNRKKIKLVLCSQSALFLKFHDKKYRVQRTRFPGTKGTGPLALRIMESWSWRGAHRFLVDTFLDWRIPSSSEVDAQ